MSDTQKNETVATEQPPAAPVSATEPGSAPASEKKQPFFTRRTVLAMTGCGVAGLVVGGVLASWGVTTASIASGRIELRTTPTKMIVTDRARCSGCQRCEMMCTLKNDGATQQSIARVRVWDNYNFGSGVDTNDGIFGNCQFTVASCKQCADPQCAKYCPVHAIHSDEETGARVVDEDVCIGCGMCSAACPWNMPTSTPRPARRPSASPAVAVPSSAPTAPSSSSIGRILPRRPSTRAWFPRPPSSRLKR